MAKRRVDWRLAEYKYVTGGPEVTCATVAAEVGAAPHTVELRCSAGKWAAKRDAFATRVQQSALQKSEDDAVAQLAAENAEFAVKFRDLAHEHIDGAPEWEKAGERMSATVAAGIAFDKWRLATGQVQGKQRLELAGDDSAPLALKLVVVDKRVDPDGSGNGNGGNGGEHTGA